MASAVEERVKFEYDLTGFGWSESRLTIGERSTEMTASYLSDALGDLLAALIDLRGGASSALLSWEEEPGEYRWLFTRDAQMVTVWVLWFDDLDEIRLPDERGEERLAGRCRLDALVRAVASSARGLLQEHSEQGYRKRWDQHDFPTASLEALEESGKADA